MKVAARALTSIDLFGAAFLFSNAYDKPAGLTTKKLDSDNDSNADRFNSRGIRRDKFKVG